MLLQTPRADLHIHTTASDGDLSPAEVVAVAKHVGLAAIAVADHDTVAGIDEARAAGQSAGVRVVPAIELSTEHRTAEVHILGYFVDHQDPDLAGFLADQERSRVDRAHAMIGKLDALGYHIEFDRVRELAGGSIGRPHVAKALVEQGFVPDLDTAMRNLLGRGCAAYVPRRKLSPVEAVEVIRRAQGAPVFAHPGQSGREWLLPDLMAAGLLGIEAYHPQHSPTQQQRYAALGRAKGLVVTGGSDYHGDHWEHNAGIGGVSVTAGVVDELLLRLAHEG